MFLLLRSGRYIARALRCGGAHQAQAVLLDLPYRALFGLFVPVYAL